jgi:hypothetical protein
MAFSVLFPHQAAKGALKPVFIYMMCGFDCCKLVINRLIGCGKKAFDRFLTLIFFNRWRCLWFWRTTLYGGQRNRRGAINAIISQKMLLIIVVFSNFWQ